MNISRKLLAKISAVCLLAIVLTSCIKDNNNTPSSSTPLALVTVIQTSPDQPPLDFYLNSSAVGTLSYGSNIAYFKAYAGKRTAYFYNIGTTSNAVYSDTVTFNANYAYSVFLANKVSSPELVVLPDTISQPNSGNASVRFINLGPDAPAVDLAIKGGSVLVANKAYKGHSSFVQVTGNKTYTLQVLQAGTSTVLATLTDVKLVAGYVYTIWLQGLSTPLNATDGLTLGVETNAFYTD